MAFYGSAIVSVLTLFTVVTSYGEANLKAPPSISGHYQIPVQALPGCRSELAYVLLIQQSGIYLHGALLPELKPAEKQAIFEEKQSLDGRWQNGKFNLEGPIVNSACLKQRLRLVGTVTGPTLTGVMQVGSQEQSITVMREEVAKPAQATH